MKAPCILILYVIQLSTTTDCCSLDVNMTVDNAFISCPTNWSCTAECYRGFIFPSGSTKEYSSCQNGVWAPMLSSCKRNPLVFVHYSAIWRLTDVLPSKCPNISTRLDKFKDMLEKTLAENCQELDVNATVQFTFSFLTFQVQANFKAEYHNFTSFHILNVCIDYNIDTFPNLQVITSIFESVTCEHLTRINYSLFKNLHVLEKQYTCLHEMELHNLTTSEKINNTQYCDTATITVLATETTQFSMSTTESPTLGTDVSFTGIDFSTSPSSTLENEVLSSDENSNISQSTTLNIEVSSNEKNNINQSTTTTTGVSSTNHNFNISQITVSTTFPSEADLNIQSIIYIVAPTGGVFLISLIIILIVCLRKGVKDPENLTDDMKMTHGTNHRNDETSFQGEMIENDLYKSADDMLDSNGDTTQTASDKFSTAPYSKEKIKNQVKVDQDEYSYPSKFKEVRLSVAFDDGTEGDLDVKASDVFQTPNRDSENSCEYATVNKSKKM